MPLHEPCPHTLYYDDAPLDQDAFPHLVDAILSACSPPALFAIRATSREFRNRVDRLLSHHIVITNPAVAAQTVSSPTTNALEVSPHCVSKRQLRGSYTLPIDLSRTRVVDLVGVVGGPSGAIPLPIPAGNAYKNPREIYLDSLANQLVNVDTVRLRTDADGRSTSLCPFRPKTLVAFTQFAEPESSYYPSIAHVGPVPDTVERLVLNIAYEPGGWWLPRANIIMSDLAHKSSLTDVVVILNPTARTPGCGRSYGEVISGQWMGMMSSIVNLMCSTLPKVRYTLIGVEKLEPEWVGIEPDWYGSPPSSTGFFDFRKDTVVHLVIEAVEAELKRRHVWFDDELDEAMARITFLTRSKYEASVGPAQFTAETVE